MINKVIASLGIFVVLFFMVIFFRWLDEEENKQEWFLPNWIVAALISGTVTLSFFFLFAGLYVLLFLPLLLETHYL